MSEREQYPAGVPCWVDTLQPDPAGAREFYGPLFGWEFAGPGPMPGELPGQYFVALVDGRDVAGIGSLPDSGGPPAAIWNTYIRVERAGEAAQAVRAAGGSVLLDPVDVPPAGRLAVVTDPVGASFSLWEAGAREGAQLVNEPCTWQMSSLHTSDPESASAFYGSVFGWQPEPFGPAEARLTLLRLPGYEGGEGGERPQQVPRDVVAVMTPTGGGSTAAVPPHWNVNFRIDDADATAELAAGLGGTVLMAPFDTPGFRNALLADPQGAVFSVSQLTAGA